jgi:hypothetical protein
LVALTFAAVMIGYGLSHTAYFSIAVGAKIASQHGSDVESGGKPGTTLFQRLVSITYIPVAISSLITFYGIIAGKSMYPRWMVVFLPIVLYLLKAPVMRLLSGRIKELVHDSYDNMVLFVFYLLSTIVLWNGFVS